MAEPIMSRHAFVLRISPAGGDRVPEALQSNHLIIGWARAAGLLDENLDRLSFREIVHQKYYSEQPDYRRSGKAAGQLWRFVREMSPGDLVVVPHGPEFYVGRIAGAPIYVESKVPEDSAYRRPVEWLNDKMPFERGVARTALRSRMKTYATCADATDLISEVRECLETAKLPGTPSFQTDLYRCLSEKILEQLRAGRLDDYGFENLLVDLLAGLGAQNVELIPRRLDKGVDIRATFRVAGTIPIVVGIQARHYQPEPPIPDSQIKEFAEAMQVEDLGFGLLVTTGTFSQEATQAAEDLSEREGTAVQLMDGEELAGLIVEHGLSRLLAARSHENP